MSELKILTPLELRANLDKPVWQDLLGPAGGKREELAERNVRGRISRKTRQDISDQLSKFDIGCGIIRP